LVSSVAPVVVGTGVTAHFGSVPTAKSLAALGVAVSLGFGLTGLIRTSHREPKTGNLVAGIGSVRRLLWPPFAWLGVALVLSIWLAASTAWWLLAVGAVAVATVGLLGRPLERNAAIGLDQLALVAAAVLLAGLGTVWAELGRLPWLGLVSAILPASLATTLLVLAKLRDRPIGEQDSAEGAVAGLTRKGTRALFQGLLSLALAVPLLITVPGLDGAECFLPWLLAPLAEGPLRNSRSSEPALRQRAVRQMVVLFTACSALLALGIWTG
jgi:1,4-dihydroxy-2-naphthoate octaprenyltransferase